MKQGFGTKSVTYHSFFLSLVNRRAHGENQMFFLRIFNYTNYLNYNALFFLSNTSPINYTGKTRVNCRNRDEIEVVIFAKSHVTALVLSRGVR